MSVIWTEISLFDIFVNFFFLSKLNFEGGNEKSFQIKYRQNESKNY